MLRLAVVVLALAGAFVPVPASLVDRAYSSGVYPVWQSWMTAASNAVPVALLDVLLVGVLLGWVAMVCVEWRRRHGRGAVKTGLRIFGRSAVWASALYLLFL